MSGDKPKNPDTNRDQETTQRLGRVPVTPDQAGKDANRKIR